MGAKNKSSNIKEIQGNVRHFNISSSYFLAENLILKPLFLLSTWSYATMLRYETSVIWNLAAESKICDSGKILLSDINGLMHDTKLKLDLSAYLWDIKRLAWDCNVTHVICMLL